MTKMNPVWHKMLLLPLWYRDTPQILYLSMMCSVSFKQYEENQDVQRWSAEMYNSVSTAIWSAMHSGVSALVWSSTWASSVDDLVKNVEKCSQILDVGSIWLGTALFSAWQWWNTLPIKAYLDRKTHFQSWTGLHRAWTLILLKQCDREWNKKQPTSTEKLWMSFKTSGEVLLKII